MDFTCELSETLHAQDQEKNFFQGLFEMSQNMRMCRC